MKLTQQHALSLTNLGLLSFIVLIIGIALNTFLALSIKYDPDQAQMLTKGMALAYHGIWTPYGNAITGGGFVPGGLITALTGIPLLIWDNAMAPQILIICLHLLAIYLLNAALKDYFTPTQRFIFLCLFWLTPWRIGHAVLWNPSYLFFVSAVHFYTATRLSSAKKLSFWSSFWLSFFHIFIIGFAFQIHASAILLAFISAYLILRKYIHINWFGVLSASTLVVLSLLPYLLAIQSHAEPLIPLADPDKEGFYGYGLVKVYPILKAALYWPRYTSTIIASQLLDGINAHLILSIIYYAIGIASMILSFWALAWFGKKIFRRRKALFRMDSIIDNYLLASILAVIASAALSPVNFANWYLLLILPFTYIVFVAFLTTKFSFLNRKQITVALFVSGVYLITISLMIPFLSHRYDLNDTMVFKSEKIRTEFLNP